MEEPTAKQEVKIEADSLLRMLRDRRVIAKNKEGRELINVTLLGAIILTVLMPQLALVFGVLVLATGGLFVLERVDRDVACC